MSQEPSWSILGRSPERQAAAVKYGEQADARRKWQDVLAHGEAMKAARAANTPEPSYEAKLAERDYQSRKAKQGTAPRPLDKDASFYDKVLNSLGILGHTFMNDEEAKLMAKVAAGGAGLAASVAAPAFIGGSTALKALTGAGINAVTGAPINLALGAPEGIAQDLVAGAAMGAVPPVLAPLAALGSYAATNINDAEAGVLKYLGKGMASSQYGKGWFYNKLKNILQGIPSGDLGPHGDHDGWIGVAKNARQLGIDPMDAKIFQRGNYGFILPKSWADEARAAGELTDESKRVYYNAMLGDEMPSVERRFEELYGLSPQDAAGGVNQEWPLSRLRAWPATRGRPDISEISVTNQPISADQFRNIWDEIGNEVVVSPKTNFSMHTDDAGTIIDVPLQEALQMKRFGKGFAGGGLVKALTRGAQAMPRYEEGFTYAKPLATGALSVVKPKGGNWLTGSVEDALRGLKKTTAEDAARQLRLANPEITHEDAMRFIGAPHVLDTANNSINQWIDGPLTKYVKTRMASPDDEVRKLAESGVLHYEPAMIRERSPLMEKVVGRRETAGFPVQGLGDSQLARSWENTSDSSLRNLTALDLSAAERDSTFGGKTVPKDTIVHEMNPFASGAGISDLGFPHLIDELSNALNPESGLPQHLQLTPEAVKQMSMEKAVRRVADINAWRAAQKVEANRILAEQASLVREYAENNPKGLRWVELKAHDVVEPSDKELIDQMRGNGMSMSEINDVMEDPERKRKAIGELMEEQDAASALADQLKYEGDTMGHCVGGYCDDVLSGRSRIFSLRDAKGEPHVTVEVSQRDYDRTNTGVPPDVYDSLQEQAYAEIQKANPKLNEESDDFMGLVIERLSDLSDDWFANNSTHNRIVQIKGKQNRAPNEEYLPFVQDFVRNSPLGGQWSDVGDLGNTGLHRAGWRPELIEEFRARNIQFPEEYGTTEEINAALNALNNAKGFAGGGAVSKQTALDAIENYLPTATNVGYNSRGWNILSEAA